MDVPSSFAAALDTALIANAITAAPARAKTFPSGGIFTQFAATNVIAERTINAVPIRSITAEAVSFLRGGELTEFEY